MEPMFYLKVVAAFLLVWAALILTMVAIRKIVDFVIIAVCLASAALACLGVYNGTFVTWGEVAGVAVGIGVIAGLICTVLFPFSTKGFQATKTPSQLASHGVHEGNGTIEQISKQDSPSTLNT